ncbi:NAD(P)/FAD-dependent oxidoreductase [Micromonospora sp. CA-259024]|uniref:NAD(P)/FAD-dependent oxidoreductase n=1 Tax=Micromonospora sp. CA-259024 TaxID=3239965 RepID=UPI003D8E5917
MSSNLNGATGEYDVIVIGGGPAGATLSALLSQRGRRVLVLERERFPRYHIGESLIPGFMRPMEELGLVETLERRGFEKKQGGTLHWGAQRIPWGFSFIEGGPYSYSYHVRRADLDSIILDRARELGVHVVEEATVKETIEEDGRIVGVKYAIRGSEVDVQEARGTMVVDASGQARVIGRKMTNVNWHDDMRNVAVWTYFDNTERLPGDEASNILIEGLPGGWFWGIPIDTKTMSVGYVTATAAASASGESLEELFHRQLGNSTQLKDLLKDARQSAGFRSARDWSYECDKFYGPGWVLVGDAAAFVDPLFSTGVALATLAGSALSKILDAVLEHPEIEEAALTRYADAYRSFFDEIRTFVGKFYDRTKVKEFYWDQAQTIVDPSRQNDPRKDFVTLVSGLGGKHPLFNIKTDDLIAGTAEPALLNAAS